MTPITYLTGDATDPQGEGVRIIAHVCNNRGGWGSGFVLAVSARWKAPEQQYRMKDFNPDTWQDLLGGIQLIPVGENLAVCNMIAQDGFKSADNPVPLHYMSLRLCIYRLRAAARLLNASVHMPRIGCDRGGGDWNIIEPLIEHYLTSRGIPVYVYDLPAA